jgi:hypothetical protein
MSEDTETIFTLIQEYLKHCPVIVWGSGATIQYGMPSMSHLKEAIGITEDGNLEEILSKITDEPEIEKFETSIFRIINDADATFRDGITGYSTEGLESLLSHFYKSHPQLINIITTNYDCVLEYLLERQRIPFSDGYRGRQFSTFSEANFKETEHVNLIKVHGSLRWCNSEYSYSNTSMNAIYPSSNKYRQAHRDPFRTLIHKSDTVISQAKAFLAVGFGFNDEHLTPKLEEAIRKQIPIVAVTKIATENTLEILDAAERYILITESDAGRTNIRYKTADNHIQETEIEGSYWKIAPDGFQSILLKRK